jgi:polysaccharide deacetylase family protein (PEP-CTERM system associated)
MIALTFDIETMYGSYQAKSKTGKNIEYSYLVQEVEYILKLCNDMNIKATFFVVGKHINDYSTLIRKISDEGHEIASHSMSHTYLYNLDKIGIKREITDSKKVLEDTCGKNVLGFRAPAWSVCESFQEFFYDTLAEAGYKYSSSVYPGKTHLYGIPHSNSVIYKTSSGIVEFPMPIAKCFGRKVGFSGGAFYRFFPDFFIIKETKRYLKNQYPVFFYFHPYEFDICNYNFVNPLRKRLLISYNRKKLGKRIKKMIEILGEPIQTMDGNITTYFNHPDN